MTNRFISQTTFVSLRVRDGPGSAGPSPRLVLFVLLWQVFPGCSMIIFARFPVCKKGPRMDGTPCGANEGKKEIRLCSGTAVPPRTSPE